MTPSHLHLCISMCMYSPFTPQMQISTYLRPDFVCKAIVPTLAPGRTKKKGERWAARRSHVTNIGALPAVSMCSDRCHQISLPRFWAKVNGRLLGGFRKAAPRSSKNLQEIWGKGSNRTLMNLPGSERSKIQLFQMWFQQHNWPYILSGAGSGNPTL